jgi:uncharacterized protein (TIGR02687 family)
VNAAPISSPATLGKEARLFLGRWKDSQRYGEVFEGLSRRIEQDLNLSGKLNEQDGYHSLMGYDAFEAIERKIVVEVRNEVLKGTIHSGKLKSAIERRETSYWFSRYRDIYEALQAAVELTEALRTLDLDFQTPLEAVNRYCKTFWRVDQLYRHFHYHLRKSQQMTLLDGVREDVERRYVNEFLLRLGDRFQNMLDGVSEWPIRGVPYQRDFYGSQVEPVVSKGNKLFVIISDALRYEVAEELHQRILKEDRFRSQLGYQLGVLPSYTQLGMAALLPKAALSIVPEKGDVHADGQRTGGLEARDNLLKKTNSRAVAVKASDFLNLNAKEEGRALARDHDLIYIYQNGIDHVGDKRETETEVFDAVAKEIETLIALLKKIAAMNGNNILITADHGFLFQQSVLEESDYTQTPEAGDMGMVNRRFAFAAKFEPCGNCKVFTAKVLGLQGDHEVAIPKSINRFRKQGSGARFVHGGAMLQEIVVPILTINKSRKSDVEQVEVDVIRAGSNIVTTSQINLSFYQETPAVEKQLGRTLRAGFYAQDGSLLSDQKELVFDSSQDDPRLRERKVSFVFGKMADKAEYQNAEILFRLEESIKGSNRFKTYKEFRYRLKKAFESDFES